MTCCLLLQKRQKEQAKEVDWKQARDKELRKRRYILQGQAEQRQARSRNTSLKD